MTELDKGYKTCISSTDDPEIYCNDTEAYLGQTHPVLTCIVDYKSLKIKSFRYEATGIKNAMFKEVSVEVQ